MFNKAIEEGAGEFITLSIKKSDFKICTRPERDKKILTRQTVICLVVDETILNTGMFEGLPGVLGNKGT